MIKTPAEKAAVLREARCISDEAFVRLSESGSCMSWTFVDLSNHLESAICYFEQDAAKGVTATEPERTTTEAGGQEP